MPRRYPLSGSRILRTTSAFILSFAPASGGDGLFFVAAPAAKISSVMSRSADPEPYNTPWNARQVREFAVFVLSVVLIIVPYPPQRDLDPPSRIIARTLPSSRDSGHVHLEPRRGCFQGRSAQCSAPARTKNGKSKTRCA